jgi:hypothetical protein
MVGTPPDAFASGAFAHPTKFQFFNPRRLLCVATESFCMDMSLVSAALAAQAGNTQMQIAATILKKNADAEKSAVLTLLGAGEPSSQANLAAGIGGNLDISV